MIKIMLKAFGYCRVSGAGQIDGNGFERQENAIRTFALKSKIEIVHVYREQVSGIKDEGKRLIKHLHTHLQHLQFVDFPRQKCLVVFHGLGVGQVRKDVAEIAVGLAFVCPGGLYQAEEHCTGLGAL